MGGCSAAGNGEFQIPDGRYNAAFDAARDNMIHRRFELERVDSRAGVITSRPKTTSGLATPWDTEQTTLDQEIEDLANGQRRIVRITFEPANPPAGSGPPDDMREVKGPIAARVEVVIERVHTPGWQVQPTAVRFSSHAEDPQLEQRAMWPSYYVPFSQDPKLAARIAAAIEEQLKK
jgi:hypothetical protein